VVVTWRGRDHIGACLAALAAQSRAHEVLVLDNASDDGTAELISGQRVLRLPRNRGYAGGLAAALPQVTTQFVAWLNDDAAPEPGWLAALEDALDADPRAAAAGGVLTDAAGVISSAGVALTADGYGTDLREPTETTFGFCGGSVLLRRGALAEAGGVPGGFFCYYEDTDTAWRLRLAGWRILLVPAARATHRLGASSRPGSWRFHRWNERNRLLTLLRCAPLRIALAQVLRFLAITLALPVRRLRGVEVPDALNYAVGLRLLVFAEVLARLPGCLGARFAIGRRGGVARSVVWRTWAGRVVRPVDHPA
jgi:GT2 family glycosyltransferase